MLLPREKPFLSGLNSYYLDIEKFIQHLQGEIGSGCLYGKGAEQELMVYFDESEIVRGLTQDNGKHALASDQLDHVLAALRQRNFQVEVYYLDPDSIFFWGQLPAFKRAKGPLSSNQVSLPDLVFRLNKKNFSGFIEIDVQGRPGCAVLFFHQGERRGGSYYWGTGGFSPSDDDYNTLLALLQKSGGSYSLGYFTGEPTAAPEVSVNGEELYCASSEAAAQKSVRAPSDLDRAVNEFLTFFVEVVKTKSNVEPLIELKLKFIDFISIYPVLDPYSNLCVLHDDGTASFADDHSAREGAEGIVDCAWMVVEDNKLHKKFRIALKKMSSKEVLKVLGIEVDR